MLTSSGLILPPIVSRTLLISSTVNLPSLSLSNTWKLHNCSLHMSFGKPLQCSKLTKGFRKILKNSKIMLVIFQLFFVSKPKTELQTMLMFKFRETHQNKQLKILSRSQSSGENSVIFKFLLILEMNPESWFEFFFWVCVSHLLRHHVQKLLKVNWSRSWSTNHWTWLLESS